MQAYHHHSYRIRSTTISLPRRYWFITNANPKPRILQNLVSNRWSRGSKLLTETGVVGRVHLVYHFPRCGDRGFGCDKNPERSPD